MSNKKRAFTLTELLVALGIVGAIAALSIPSLLTSINKRILTAQIKSTYGAIQQVVFDEMISKKTKNLKETDFASPTKLLSSDHFQIIDNCTTVTDCWGTSKYRNLSNMQANAAVPGGSNGRGNILTRRLKTGAVISYQTMSYTLADGDKTVGQILFDVNGKAEPNIVGRDFFMVYPTERGKLVDYETAIKANYGGDAGRLNQCKSGSIPSACLTLIINNNWVMDY